MSETFDSPPATVPDTRTPSFNGWFLALHEKRQAILREDKWMLATSAFDAGVAAQKQQDSELLRDFELFLNELPRDLGRGSLNGMLVQLQHKLQLALGED